MTEDEARRVELVRAIELEDREAALFTREDRAQADAVARAAGGTAAGTDGFLVARANFAATRLATRHPGIAKLLETSRWPRWLAIGLPLAAMALGFAANELGTARRMELLAVPLLGTLAWNVLVYLGIIGGAFRRKRAPPSLPLASTFARWRNRAREGIPAGTPLQRAVDAFQARWLAVTAPLVHARAARTLHLGAALFAVGLIGGIYLRALVIEYRAGWESTFLSPASVRAILATALGPASLVTGVPIPDTATIAAMRWTGPPSSPSYGGVNAAPWIYLYTATVMGLVVIPRLLLAALAGSRALRLGQKFPMPGREDFYVRRLLRSTGGPPASVRVTPYAYTASEATKQRLGAALRAAIGDGTDVRFDPPIAYGDEERWLAASAIDPDEDYRVLLFTLATTPEAENHGALAVMLARRMASEAPGSALAAIVDEAPFRAHFAGQSGLEQRLAGRVDGWRGVLGAAGISPLAIDLSMPADEAMARRIEAGLSPDGALRR